jgi:hypothetical protein
MSLQSDRFLEAAQRSDWETAYYYLNGLNMYEMLRSLNSLSRLRLEMLRLQAFRFASRYNVDRIDYAIHVVESRELPNPPPGDLDETGQVQTAREFLNETRVPAPAPPYSPPVPPPPPASTNDINFYHGTSLDQAKQLMTMDLKPFAVAEALLLDVNEYTDFGKGFYTHPEESKEKAVEWAKRKNREWGVVRFTLTTDEMSRIATQPLLFADKFKSRPPNAPKLFDDNPATWIEFVEFNRHVRTTSIQRPKDNDWTADYGWIRGPIWGRADSGLPGAPGLPERYHQINWGLDGLAALNLDAAKKRRFLFDKSNEPLLGLVSD